MLKNIRASPERAACIEIYARTATATKRVTSTQDPVGADCWEDDGPAKIELTYSTLQAINRARQAFGMPALRIIQVATFVSDNDTVTIDGGNDIVTASGSDNTITDNGPGSSSYIVSGDNSWAYVNSYGSKNVTVSGNGGGFDLTGARSIPARSAAMTPPPPSTAPSRAGLSPATMTRLTTTAALSP